MATQKPGKPGRPRKDQAPVMDPFELPYLLTPEQAARLFQDKDGGRRLMELARQGRLPEGTVHRSGRSVYFYRNAFLQPEERQLIAERIAQLGVEEANMIVAKLRSFQTARPIGL